jgi:GntR family transcriptional regulator
MSLGSIVRPLDRSNPMPLYRQLRRSLREAIDQEVLAPDDSLPAERDIAIDFGVSRITVRKALEGLVDEGLLDRRHGAGTFVASRIQKNMATLSSFSEDIASRGWQASSQWLSKTEAEVTPSESLALGLPPESVVYRFDRIRFAEDKPLAIEHAIVPASCLPSMDAVGKSLYAALEQTGNRPTKALQRLQAMAFDTEQARLLGVNKGDPGLFIERRGYLDDGRIVEVTRSYYRGDAYDFVAELST